MGDAGKLPMLAHTMEREGFTPQIEAVFCKVLLRVCKEVLAGGKLYTEVWDSHRKWILLPVWYAVYITRLYVRGKRQ